MKKRDPTRRHQVTLYNNGGRIKYRGEVVNDLYDGWGVLYNKSSRYTGYWEQGKKSGYGENVARMKLAMWPSWITWQPDLEEIIKEEKYVGW